MLDHARDAKAAAEKARRGLHAPGAHEAPGARRRYGLAVGVQKVEPADVKAQRPAVGREGLDRAGARGAQPEVGPHHDCVHVQDGQEGLPHEGEVVQGGEGRGEVEGHHGVNVQRKKPAEALLAGEEPGAALRLAQDVCRVGTEGDGGKAAAPAVGLLAGLAQQLLMAAVEAVEGPDGADPMPGQVALPRRRHDGARGTAPGHAEGHGAPRGTPRRRQRPLRKTPSAAP